MKTAIDVLCVPGDRLRRVAYEKRAQRADVVDPHFAIQWRTTTRFV